MKRASSLYLTNETGIPWKNRAPLLTAIDMELTERCNNRCVHCGINQPEKDAAARERELGTAAWQELLRQAADLGALTVRFTGGEPLLREDFTELYLHARRLGLRVLLFTNARLITPELADLFARIPPLEEIEITSYGMTAASYESVSQQKGSFSEFRSGVDLLLARKIPVIIKGTLLPATRHEMNDFIAWTGTMPSFVMFLELRSRRDSEEKNERIRQLRLPPGEGVRILSTQPDIYRRDMYRICRECEIKPTDRIFTCNQGNKLCIDAYGKIQYCLALRHPDTVLDSRAHTLKAYLTDYLPALRSRRSENAEFLQRCARCYLRSFCDQCPAKSWMEHGVLDQPVEYVCEIAHEQARYLGLLEKEEQAWTITDWPERLKQLADRLQ